MTDYYQVLGVPPNASNDEIHQRYRFLAKAYHPDRFLEQNAKAQAEEEMKKINEAYTVVSNEAKRAAYDATLARGAKKSDPDTSRKKTAEYYNLLSTYFEQLFTKWEGILNYPPDTQDVGNLLRIIIESTNLFLGAVYPSNKNENAKHLMDDIQQSITVLMMMGLCIGAEVETTGLPKEYQLVELEMFACMPFFEKLTTLSRIVTRSNSLSSDQRDQITNNLVEVAFRLTDVCVNIGKTRVKNPAASSNKSSSHPTTQQWNPSEFKKPNGFCQSCFQFTPTLHLTFRQNVGAIIMRFTRKVEGDFCAACAARYFWRMTGMSLIFGWWGVISFFTTPFILIANLVNYIQAWKLRSHPDELIRIELGWKFVIIVVLGLATYFLIGTNNLSNSSQNVSNSSTLSTHNQATLKSNIQNINIYPTSTEIHPIIRATPTSANDCTLWSNVTAADKGKTMCVYGTAKDSYFGDNIYYIMFSNSTTAFRFLVLNGYYFDGVKGNCVEAEGVVKTYGQMPYIEVGEHMYKCIN
jgi:DnaJ-domain-containing protein 1